MRSAGAGQRMVTKRPERSLFVVACKDGRPGDGALNQTSYEDMLHKIFHVLKHHLLSVFVLDK